MKRCRCCHRELKDPISIERGCGPTCYAKRPKEFIYQTELNFEPKFGEDKSAIDKHRIVAKILESGRTT
ncbi:MAG: DUF6011 domain-containing protein [Sporomusaceae bacterium]|nr:DUF6011 domain-containing protein [Sporomusaceae bacterium]